MERLNSGVFTPEERLRANDSVYQCDDLTQLQRWHRNVCRVELERELAQAVTGPCYATTAQKQELVRLCGHKAVTRPEKTKVLLQINRLTEQEAGAAIDTLTQAIADQVPGDAGWTQLLGWLDAAGITHTHLLAA